MHTGIDEVLAGRRGRCATWAAVAATVAGAGVSARAEETSWIGPAGPPASQHWLNTSNWTNGRPDQVAEASISNGNLARVDGDPGQPLRASTVYIGKNAGETGFVMAQDGCGLTATTTHVGYNGTGTFYIGEDATEFGSRLKTTTLYVGTGTGSSGTIELRAQSGAALSTYNLEAETQYIGFNGSGFVNQLEGYSLGTEVNVGYLASGVGRYDLAPGTRFSAQTLNVGFSGTGEFNAKGSVETPTLTLATLPGSVGTFRLGPGGLAARIQTIGRYGEGTFIHTHRSNNYPANTTQPPQGTIILGEMEGAKGTYDMSVNPGIPTQLGAERVYVGHAGEGLFKQSGGTALMGHFATTASGLFLGYGATGKGRYELSGTGSLTAYDVTVGYDGAGTFVQGGGTATVSGDLNLGQRAGSSGTYELGGGTLNSTDVNVAVAGTGTFKQTGGTHVATQTITIGAPGLSVGAGGAAGAYELSAGSLSAGGLAVSGVPGTFKQTGGTVDIAFGLDLAGTFSNLRAQFGTYELVAGSLTVGSETLGRNGHGTFRQSGGTHVVEGALMIGTSGGGTTRSGRLDLTGGTLDVGSLALGSGSTVLFEVNDADPADIASIDVTGITTVDGILQVRIDPAQFASLDGGDVFTLIDAGSTLAGAFDNVASGARLTTVDGFGSFLVSYGAGSAFGSEQLTLSDFQAIPEPAGATLLLAAASTALLARRRR